MAAKIVFFAGLALSATGLLSPSLALLAGILFALVFAHPYEEACRSYSKFPLQVSVVGLGFGMNLHEVLRAGRSGFLYTAIGIIGALAIGLALGRILSVDRKASFLIATGTAICGGSAIAAVAPITQADDHEIAVSIGTVFVLNSVALLLFPSIGLRLHLTQPQFGLWAALAIHDTSSVVGAAAKYGAEALSIGTTVKLARALWIVPLSIVTAYAMKSKARIQWPWFILFFCLAAVAKTYVPAGAPFFAVLSRLGKLGLTATLFLIGASLSKSALRQVGLRPLLQGVVLWAIVAVVTLLAIRSGWVAL